MERGGCGAGGLTHPAFASKKYQPELLIFEKTEHAHCPRKNI